MAKYFEPISLFPYSVKVEEHPTKVAPRISIDMGLGTFLTFAMNEAYIFGLRWGPEKAAYSQEKERVMALMKMAKEYTANLEKYYTTLDYFRGNPHLEDLAHKLMEGSYNTGLWEWMIKAVEAYESITEDQE